MKNATDDSRNNVDDQNSPKEQGYIGDQWCTSQAIFSKQGCESRPKEVRDCKAQWDGEQVDDTNNGPIAKPVKGQQEHGRDEENVYPVEHIFYTSRQVELIILHMYRRYRDQRCNGRDVNLATLCVSKKTLCQQILLYVVCDGLSIVFLR